jgi:hypothetical protein
LSFPDTELLPVGKPGSIPDHAAEVTGTGNGRRRRQGERYYTRVFIGYASQDMAVDIAVGEAFEHKGYGLIRS